MSESCAVTPRSTWALERNFSTYIRTGERPIALLNENSGQVMGKKAVPQANPSAMKQPGRERRRGERWRCSLYRLFVPHRRCYRHAEERRHARKSDPSREVVFVNESKVVEEVLRQLGDNQ